MNSVEKKVRKIITETLPEGGNKELIDALYKNIFESSIRADIGLMLLSVDDDPNATEEEIAKYRLFVQWLAEFAKSVTKMAEPITLKQYRKIREELTNKELVKNTLTRMHNWKELTKKNTSAYLTLRKWYRESNSAVIQSDENQKLINAFKK